MKTCFVVPGKPQGKGRPRFTRSGHTYTPDSTAEYEERVKLAYRQAGGGKLSGFAYDDDAQIVKLYVEKRYGAFGHVTVVLEGASHEEVCQ